MEALIAFGILAGVIVLALVVLGIWLALLGLGALFGTWFVSGGSLEDNKNMRPEILAEVFRVREPKKEDKK